MPTSTTNILLPYICGPPQLFFSSYLIFKRQVSQSLLVNKMTPIPYLYNTNNFLKSSIVFNSTINIPLPYILSPPQPFVLVLLVARCLFCPQFVTLN